MQTTANKPKALSFFGPQQVGKSTIAKHICAKFPERFRYRNFAGPIYAMAEAFYGELPAEKEAPQELSGGKSLREFMQLLGTEFGREGLYQDVWMNQLKFGIQKDNTAGLITVVDDCRFMNEFDMLTEAGAVHIEVSREGHGSKGTHLSEIDWQNFKADAHLRNSFDTMAEYEDYAEGIAMACASVDLMKLTSRH